MFIIDAVNVTRHYTDGDVTAIDDVTLGIDVGQYAAIVGPSGSGKSTLLNLIGGLDHPTSGTIHINGVKVQPGPTMDRLRARTIGYVFQSFYLLPTLSAIENIQIPMFETKASASQRRARASELLEIVGLNQRANHLPSQLSVGQRQRIAIARSLANEPKLLLADEPTGNLDSASGEEILTLFESLHRDQALTLVVITHSAEVASRAERVIEIRDGKIYADSPATSPS